MADNKEKVNPVFTIVLGLVVMGVGFNTGVVGL